MKKLVATLSLAGLLVAGSAGVALAQDPGAGSTGADAPTAQPRRHRVKHAAKVAADTIGITTQELRDALKSGKSIAQVAQEHGVDPAAVVDAIVQARTAKLQARAQKLVDRVFGASQ